MRSVTFFSAIAVVSGALAVVSGQQQSGDQPPFRFRTGVELINVTAAVTDGSGRFVSGLRKEDFRVYEDGVEQPVTHFSNERVPVSLGIALDTSGSMAGPKMTAARQALERFIQALDPVDEVFLYRFDSYPDLVQEWTSNTADINRALARIQPRGSTALYDTVAEAVPLAQSGRNRKKALIIISDGQDTSSRTGVSEVKQLIRQTEVLVYAVGIDGESTQILTGRGGRPPGGIRPPARPPRLPIPIPFPRPGAGRMPPRMPPAPYPPGGGGSTVRVSSDRVNAAALRDITDDSGGRTEIVRTLPDLDPATSGIADELSKQYYLGYPSTGKRDGQWHSIRVDVRNPSYRVRARRGYVATP